MALTSTYFQGGREKMRIESVGILNWHGDASATADHAARDGGCEKKQAGIPAAA